MWLDVALNIGMNAMTAAYPYLALHTTGAASSSTNEATSSRVAASWAGAATGDTSVTSKSFTGGAANGPVVRVGYWTLSSAGTFGGGSLLTGDQTFNAAGEYTITSIAENSSSS